MSTGYLRGLLLVGLLGLAAGFLLSPQMRDDARKKLMEGTENLSKGAGRFFVRTQESVRMLKDKIKH